jgi:drug/metabolite transporter (DMT)-like permease
MASFMPSLFTRRSPLVILPFFLWGTAMVVMKGILPQMSPLLMAGLRLLPAGLLLLVVAGWQKRPWQISFQGWLWVLLFALVDGTLFQGFLALGLERTGAGLGSLLIDSQPLAVAVFAALFYQEKISLSAVVGLVVGLAGIILIGVPHDLWTDVLAGNWSALWDAGLFTMGEWLMLGAALSMALGTILIRPVVRYADPVVATGWHMILGGLPLLFAALGRDPQNLYAIDLTGWLGIGYMTVMGSALAYGLFFFFASSGSLTSLSALTFSTPVFALLFSRLFLGEKLAVVQWWGVVLTLTSIYLVSAKPDSETEDLTKTNTPIPVTENGVLVSPEILETEFSQNS